MEIVTNFVIGLVTALAGYIFGLRRNNAETDSIVIDNVKELLSVYSQTIMELRNEIRELKDKIDLYETLIENLKKDLRDFRDDMNKNA